MRFLRHALWILIAIVVIGLGVFVALREPPAPRDAGGAVQLAPISGIGGDFALVDQKRRPYTQAELLGHPTLLFFGYTFCPDVCPTTLIEAQGWMKELGADADGLQVVFVTVDPERDTPEKLGEYLSSFDPRFVGLSGPRAAIDRIVAEYRVFARKVEGKGGDYTMDHTAAVYLLDRQGRFVGLINYQEETTRAMAKIRRLLAMN